MHRNYGSPGSLAHVYARLHATRFDHIEQARRARDYQARLASANTEPTAYQLCVMSLLCGMVIGASLTGLLALAYR
jgi:hypothetical protein